MFSPSDSLHRFINLEQVLKAIEACNENVPEHLAIPGDDYATPEGVAWETLLDELELQQLVVTYNKDDTFATVD